MTSRNVPFRCLDCGWTGSRYPNTKRCPECHGLLRRDEKDDLKPLRALVRKWRSEQRLQLDDAKHAHYPTDRHSLEGQAMAHGECARELKAVIDELEGELISARWEMDL